MISSDEHKAYDALNALYQTERVNHLQYYVGPKGESTNLADSFFSRIRRMQVGYMRLFGKLYLNRYANEAAYRENTRRQSNGSIFKDIMTRRANAKPFRHFVGYRQGNKKPMKTLI